MPNSNPFHARMAKRRARKPGDLAALKITLWRALLEAERVLLESDDDELSLKAVHALSQASGQYLKLLEIGEFEASIAALEASAAQVAPLLAR
jgi:hypothetical protein